MVSPVSTDEVAATVRACAASCVSIVPQGGNTGMCAGAVPDASGTQIILSLARMTRIRSVDAENFSMEVEAGCVLKTIQDAALHAGRYFPLSMGAEGSCQIGGNLSTNAGGVNVLRYGTARSQVLGLEAVLADGTVVNSLRALRKDTAGYDLKQLFIGSEGTLGIITAAVLRLQPDPGERNTAWIAIRHSGDAVELLALLRTALGDTVEAFELVSGDVFALLEQHIPGVRLPFETRYPWYVLTEVAHSAGTSLLEDALMKAVESGLVPDAVIAKNAREAESFWHWRHSIADAERLEGKALKHDISVPVSKIAAFLERGEAMLATHAPQARLLVFGHVGDGNLHYNVMLPNDFRSGLALTTRIYELVTSLGGSISAEHGVGQFKKAALQRFISSAEFDLMKTLKKAMDPLGILNPGKVI
jgi:FAD/FMN-containing dehydrogenase